MIMVEKYENYDKYPTKEIMGYKAWRGYANIAAELKQRVAGRKKAVIVLETYTEVDVAEILEGLKERYATEKVTDIDGVKIDFAQGWVHLRKSNTEPIIRIYSEAKDEAAANQLAEEVIAAAKSTL